MRSIRVRDRPPSRIDSSYNIEGQALANRPGATAHSNVAFGGVVRQVPGARPGTTPGPAVELSPEGERHG